MCVQCCKPLMFGNPGYISVRAPLEHYTFFPISRVMCAIVLFSILLLFSVKLVSFVEFEFASQPPRIRFSFPFVARRKNSFVKRVRIAI